MKAIYLASDSKARKKLLDIFGLKFKVMPAKIREARKLSGSSCAQLAKQNAMEKAKFVAAKINSGIVIAADTLVVQDGKVYGKPEDLADARRMLKRLSGKPQWLYTGLVVIDKDRQKTMRGCEKTKVYMDKLNDKQINEYFARTSPMDKAGSFDIQGRGAFFIRRIEGCFYNVVGLPVRKLYRMLKELKIPGIVCCVLSIGYCLMLSGCTTEYNLVTKEEEIYFYSTDKEVQMGSNIARQVAEQYKPVDDPLIQKRVEDIGKKIAAVCDRKDIDYHFFVLNEDEVNAVSLPGGYVYIFKGLIDKVDSDDELAGVIGHEVGHIVARHSIKKLQGQMGYSLLRVMIAQASKNNDVGNAADLAFADIMSGYSREDELLADELGTRYAKLAGYDPQGMIEFLSKLHEINRRKPAQPFVYFKSHPYVPDRIRVVRQELGGRMTFNDYINIEQKPHQR